MSSTHAARMAAIGAPAPKTPAAPRRVPTGQGLLVSAYGATPSTLDHDACVVQAALLRRHKVIERRARAGLRVLVLLAFSFGLAAAVRWGIGALA